MKPRRSIRQTKSNPRKAETPSVVLAFAGRPELPSSRDPPYEQTDGRRASTPAVIIEKSRLSSSMEGVRAVEGQAGEGGHGRRGARARAGVEQD